MVSSDDVLAIIRRKGPVIPADITQETGLSLLFASAVLSELASKGVIRISSVKIGGSPLYYLPEQAHQLQRFADKLNEKDRRTYELLKERKILRDKELEPLQRVSVRQIRDFAKPLRVKTREGEEIFWKWYLLPKEEAEKAVRQMLAPEQKREEEPEKPAREEEKREKPRAEAQLPLSPRKSGEGNRQAVSDDFIGKVKAYFSSKGISVISENVVRRGSEAEFVVRVPSAAGTLVFWCKAKNKKRISDKDLSSIYLEGQSKKMPVLLVVTGELTKKAGELLRGELKGMAFARV